MIDKKQFFCIPEKLTKIDHAIESLMKKEETRWPCSREEEVGLHYAKNNEQVFVFFLARQVPEIVLTSGLSLICKIRNN
jgi:hypothetical protein